MSEKKRLYAPEELKLMRAAHDAKTAGAGRVEELIKFAAGAGIKRIGIANCIAFPHETELLKKRLEEQFDVFSIDCKVGKVSSAEMLDDETAKGISCNPAAQADYLAEMGTQLNISFGLCMGHDLLFNMKSVAPVTTLLIKDRKHRHNPYKEFEL